MAIVNVTPDSFYDGGRLAGEGSLLRHAERCVAEGAAILDVGGASSRPGAAEVSAAEERTRVVPAVEALRRAHPSVLLSVDTYRAEVAEAAVDAGADIVNDVSGGSVDAAMWATVARLGVPYVAAHMRGTPATMQDAPEYGDDVVAAVYRELQRVSVGARDAGVVDVVVDPGFGFGKTDAHNFELLARLGEFAWLRRPVLVGISRKSTLQRTLGVDAAGALNGTTALHMEALRRGADILRVHDVAPAAEAIALHLAVAAYDLTYPPAVPLA